MDLLYLAGTATLLYYAYRVMPRWDCLDEFDQMRDLRRVRGVGGLERAEGDGEVAVLFQEELLVGGLERADVVLGESPALQADDVEPAGFRRDFPPRS